MKHIWWTAYKQAISVTAFWGLVFIGAFLSRDLRLDSMLLCIGVGVFSVMGISVTRTSFLPFLRLHSKSIVDYFKYDTALILTVWATNVAIAILYAFFFLPHLGKIVSWMPIQTAWACVIAFLMTLGFTRTQQPVRQKPLSVLLMIFGIYLWIGLGAAIAIYSMAIGTAYIVISLWTWTIYREPNVVAALHARFRKRVYATGLGAFAIAMIFSIAISLIRHDSFSRVGFPRSRVYMGERERY